MSYGAYGMKINPSTGFAIGATNNDVLYNLGGLLGAIWANNYNQRGIKKGAAEGQNAISDALKAYMDGYGQTDGTIGALNGGNVTVDGQQVALPGGAQQLARTNGTYESAGNIGAGANGINLGQGIKAAPQGGTISSMDFAQPQSTAISATGSIPQQYQPQNLTVNGQQVPSANFSQPQPQATPSSDASANGQGVAAPAVEAPRDLKAEKQDYVVQKYSGTDNPEEDKRTITATALAAKGQIANANLSNIPLSKESLSAIARSEMLKNGRTPYQIEQVMKIIEPDIVSKVEQNNAQQFNALYDIYKQQVQSGQIDASALTYARMRQLNPTLAEGLSGQFKRNQSDFLEQYKYDQSVKMLMKNRGYSEQEAKNFLETGDTRYSQKDLQSMGYIAGKAPSYSYGGSGRGSRGSRGGGGGYGGGRSRSVAGGGSMSKGPTWDKRVEWARSVLENPNASPELKQSATNVLRAYDRYMAGDNYVVPASVVKAELQKAIGNGELTYDEARNWIYFDSGLGEDEQRIVDKWFRDTYGDMENPDSEGGREEFDAVLSNNTSTSTPEPEEVPNANGHTGILASLEALGEAWDNFKLKDVANWVKNH
jgi:hypothetical protein|nr:MAG TPA: neurotoxin [Caudoviricetes sp.]